MAEAVVGILIGKLGEALVNEAAIYGASLLCKESSTLVGLFGEMRKAEAELEIMQAYLHDAEKFKDTNETTDIFVKKIRGLAFRIEDVVDEFMYILQDKHGGVVANVKKRIKHVKIWRRLALELQGINTELEDVTKRRDRYAVPGVEGHTGRSHHATSINQTVWFAREEDLVGIDDSVEKLTRWLTGDLEGRRNKIVTVWGMGGVGKTTLVHHVYKIVKTDFENAAWVTATRSYDVEDLLKKMARALGILDDTRNMELRNLVESIHNFLGGKRCILVLDDVWDMETWIKIMDVFPSNCTSRIVLTSRKYEVASLATSDCSIKLEPLEENHSWKLFCNLAFRNDGDKRCPLELQSLAAKFLQKCEGLPLAIACIGRLLSCKSPTYSVWKDLYEELELQSNKNVVPGVDIIFRVSLEDLPYELKNCILHCAIFPEDYGMHRRRLTKHWITAGFIKEKEHKTLEQVAEGYLNELVNRSLLQVVEKNETGRVRCCRMHDIVRCLALDKAEKECFGKVYEGSEAFSIDGARRLTINSANVTRLSQSAGATHLRAIHAFTSSLDIDLLKHIIASSNLLSTLDLQGTQIKYLPNDVFSLFNLRLLGLRYTSIEVLPEALGRLKNLEVLDAHGTCLRSLPKNMAKLKKLRFLYASGLLANETFARYDGIMVPSGIKNLTGLHALQTVKASVETLHDVAALRELRTLSVCDVTSEYSLNLCNVIMNMRHLAHLSVRASSRNEVLPWEAHTLPESLCKLRVRGQLEKKQMPGILSSWSHLKNLTRLSLIFSKLDEDSFSSLVMLRGLRLLRLTKAYDGKKLCLSALSFRGLRRLEIRGAPELSQVEIEEGALESLVELEFSDCPELKCLPHGIEYLTALEELRLQDTAEELIEKLRQEGESNECNGELMRISHIKKVVVKLTERKLWERIR